jgi:hypothetical protein
VEVAAQSLQLNTVEASQGQVIENQPIVEMPLNGRYHGDLALLSAATVPSVGGSRFNTFSSGGQRVTQNNYILDGIDNNSVEIAAAGRRAEMVQPPIDAVQEFKVQVDRRYMRRSSPRQCDWLRLSRSPLHESREVDRQPERPAPLCGEHAV